jgi:hypothetical protein
MNQLFMRVEEIARICHEVNRAYCASIQDFSQKVKDALFHSIVRGLS